MKNHPYNLGIHFHMHLVDLVIVRIAIYIPKNQDQIKSYIILVLNV